MVEPHSDDKSLLYLVEVLWAWRKRILLMTVLAALVSIIASMLLPTYYQSKSIFYAASQDLAKPQPIGDNEREVEYYGTDRDIDRLLTLLSSSQLKLYLINKYNLYDHYDIDSTGKKAGFKIREKLSKLMTVQKTKYDAIQLSIEDQDPALAQTMAADATQYINELAAKSVKSSQSDLLNSYGQKIAQSELQLSIISDSLQVTKKKYEIFDLLNQGEVLLSQQSEISNDYSLADSKYQNYINTASDSISYYKSLRNSYKAQLNTVTNKIDQFNTGYNQVYTLDRQQLSITRQLGIDKERLRQLSSSYESVVPFIHIVEEAELPLIKSRPKRSLYVIGATFLAFALTSLFALLMEMMKGHDWSFLKK